LSFGIKFQFKTSIFVNQNDGAPKSNGLLNFGKRMNLITILFKSAGSLFDYLRS